jgi:hypothetical protein
VKPVRLALVVAVPLCVLVLGLLWLQYGTVVESHAAPPGATLAAVTNRWPPVQQNLSQSADRDSGGAATDADGGNVVVVWAEGSSAQGLNDGLIKMAWSRAEDSTWRTLVVPAQRTGFVHYHPTVALYGATAHVVWVREDILDPGKGNTQIRYAQCNLVSGVCDNYAGITPEDRAYARLAPDIAVDPSGVPHVVWIQQQGAMTGTVWYNNRVGGSWSISSPERVSGGSTSCAYTQDNPAIAVDDQHVYVTWDENVQRCVGSGGTAGIYFRQRSDVTSASGSGSGWWPGGEPWGKQLSQAAATFETSPDQIDGFPAIGVGEGWVYVLWERFVYSRTLPVYGAVYTYSLAYRVYTGTLPQDDWWPGGASADRWATLPFTSASATDLAEYYAGLRPALDIAGRTPHVVWHAWSAPSISAAREELDLLGELPSEHLVDSRYPYKVSYATYRQGVDPRDLEQGQASWVSTTVQVLNSDHILAWPALAWEAGDDSRTSRMHIALHQRQGFVAADDSYAWDVLYTNDDVYYAVYLPAMLKQASVSSAVDVWGENGR